MILEIRGAVGPYLTRFLARILGALMAAPRMDAPQMKIPLERLC
jgi:hypothetical protein